MEAAKRRIEDMAVSFEAKIEKINEQYEVEVQEMQKKIDELTTNENKRSSPVQCKSN